MSNTHGVPQSYASPGMFPRIALPDGALDGVRTRRMLAVCVDVTLVALIVATIWVIATVATLGLALVALFALPPLFPIVAFFYNGLSVSGEKMGTPGMRLFDLAARDAQTGGRASFISAAVHGVLFYVSWLFPPVLLVALVADAKRCLHDMFAGVLITRR